MIFLKGDKQFMTLNNSNISIRYNGKNYMFEPNEYYWITKNINTTTIRFLWLKTYKQLAVAIKDVAKLLNYSAITSLYDDSASLTINEGVNKRYRIKGVDGLMTRVNMNKEKRDPHGHFNKLINSLYKELGNEPKQDTQSRGETKQPTESKIYMVEELYTGKFNEKPIRTLILDGIPHAEALRTAEALGYKNPSDAIKRHCKNKISLYVQTANGVAFHDPDQMVLNKDYRAVKFIPLSDIDRLIVHSKLPEAQKFEKWVFEDVLQSVQLTGSYQAQPSPVQIESKATPTEYSISLPGYKDPQLLSTDIAVQSKKTKKLQKKLEKEQRKLQKKQAKMLWIQKVDSMQSIISELVEENGLLKSENESIASLKDYFEFQVNYFRAMFFKQMENSSNNYTATQLGEPFGLSNQDVNKILADAGVIEKRSDGTWRVTNKYYSKNLTDYRVYDVNQIKREHMVWNEKGKFLFNCIMKRKYDIVPESNRKLRYVDGEIVIINDQTNQIAQYTQE